jgi:methylglutamate dehydrogenase subunit D
VAEFSWAATTPLSRVYQAGRHGMKGGEAGLSMAELADFELLQVMARRGQWGAVALAAEQQFGAKVPVTPLAVTAGRSLLIWSGPDQFLVLSARTAGNSAIDGTKQAFAGVASLSEQSDGRSLLRIAGPRARDMLAKVCSLDLHPAIFPVGTSAATSIDHTSVNLWRGEDGADGAAVFYLLVFTSFAESLWRTLLDSGAEYGIEVGAPTAWQV